MSFTIYHTPFDGISPNVTPIYNGLPYSLLTVSQWYERPGFKYVADIYVDGGTDRVARLKHDADKDTNLGVFDFGRIIENWVYNEAPVNNSTLQSFSPFNDKEKSVIPFEIKWGMEMDRYDIIFNWLPSLGNARLVADAGNHNQRTGDYVVIRGCSEDSYNGAHRILGTTTSTIRIYVPYVSNPTDKGEFIEAEGFYDNNYWYDYDQQRSFIGWIIPTSRPTEIEVGDTVTIIQDAGATNPGYDGEWLVVDIDTTVVGGTTYQRIKTNCPFLGNTPVNGGAIYPTNRKRINENLDTSGGYVFNGVLQYDEYLDWDPSEYILGFTSGKFLTNLPQLNMIKGLHPNTDNTRMLKCSPDEYLTLSFFYGNLKDENINQVYFVFYDENNNIIQTGLDAPATPNTADNMVDVGVGPKNITLFSPNPNPPTGTKYYTVELRYASTQPFGLKVGERITIYLTECNTRYTNKRIKYLNRLGGWDYFDFKLRSDETVEVERSQFRRNLRQLNSSNDYTYRVGDRGNTTYNVNALRSERVRTNWLTPGEANVLEELWTSPQVFLLKDDPKGNPKQYPINITSNNLDKGKGENFGLIRYEIDYEFSNNIMTQRL